MRFERSRPVEYERDLGDEGDSANRNVDSRDTRSQFENYGRTTRAEDRISRAIEDTLNTVREASVNNQNTRFLNQMSAAKTVQSFSGDPFDWIRFKKSFETLFNLDYFTEGQILMKLAEALRGEARDAVNGMFISGSSASEIMKNLEMRFGNTTVILEKIIKDIKELPSVKDRKITLVDFATRLHAAVLAVKKLDVDEGYLKNRELVSSLIQKLPETVAYNYGSFAMNDGKNLPALLRIAEYVYKEAEMKIISGIVTLDSEEVSKQSKSSRHSTRHRERGVYATHEEEVERAGEGTRSVPYACVKCERDGHSTAKCKEFEKLPLNDKWRMVRTNRLCFNCLKRGHRRDKCVNEPCEKCGRAHHCLLHSSRQELNGNKE